MSRPFSYNDDNFTVIGNLLFCHIKISKNISPYTNIIEVPPAIAERLIYKSSLFMHVADKFNNAVSENINIGLRKDNKNHYYLYTSSDISTSNSSYIAGFYFLKDI